MPADLIDKLIASDEHVARLQDPGCFDSLHRRDGFFDDGLGTIFGVKAGEAELQSFCFQAGEFTPAEARRWLREHGFAYVSFTEGGASQADPT
jgi:hypothetical protein